MTTERMQEMLDAPGRIGSIEAGIAEAAAGQGSVVSYVEFAEDVDPLVAKLVDEFDASVWAVEFCKLFGDESPDEGTMIGWFANAIMAGYDRGRLSSMDDYSGACKTIALMHEAATGRKGMAPARGVVEDVADLRTVCEMTEARCSALERLGYDLRVVARSTTGLDGRHPAVTAWDDFMEKSSVQGRMVPEDDN